jgi:hypothetical protein
LKLLLAVLKSFHLWAPAHHEYNKNKTAMFYSVLILLYFLTQMMDIAHKVNIKCDIQYVYLEMEPAMSSTV